MDTTEVIRNINRIIQVEDKTSTYKFALLRGTIEVIQENSPFIEFVEDRVHIPTGLLVEKWLYYYYPLFCKNPPVRQIKSSENLAFGKQFTPIVAYYGTQEALSRVSSDLHLARVPMEIRPELEKLLVRIQTTITKMPMRHLGHSIRKQHYEVCKPESGRSKLDLATGMESVIHHLGTYSIPKAYHEALMVYGSFITGQDSLLFQWAQLTEAFTKSGYKTSQVLDLLGSQPVKERTSPAAQVLFKEMAAAGNLDCIWTGKSLKRWEVDHIIPFSIWRNNDLWNMLPCDKATNGPTGKWNAIPSPDILIECKDRILNYWQMIHVWSPAMFESEIKLALLGNKFPQDWKQLAFERLVHNCTQLIQQRGFQQWPNK